MTDRVNNKSQDVGSHGSNPLGWPPFIVTAVHNEYFEARPYDGSAYGDTLNVAKSPEQRESLNEAVAYGATNDIIQAAPVYTVVRNDADSADVVCQWVQVSAALPAGRTKHQVLSVIDDNGKVDFDWVRAFDDA